MDAFNENERPALIISGPTASGKSEVAVRVSELLGCEIICADSMQIYKRLSVGTAAPNADQLARVPHHLYAFVEPDSAYSVAQYVQNAKEKISDIYSQKKLPLLCGGTGLYLSSLAHGIRFCEAKSDSGLREKLKAELEEKGLDSLKRKLLELDQNAAKYVDMNNPIRVTRAIELTTTLGESMESILRASQIDKEGLKAVWIVLYSDNRAALYDRISKRVDDMLKSGLLGEARYVYDNRQTFTTAAQAIGYKELFPYFEGRTSLEDCVEQLKTSTRHYAKRQLTWFKREKEAVWLDVDSKDAETTAQEIINLYTGK